MSKERSEELMKMETSLEQLEISQRKSNRMCCSNYNETVPINRLPIEVFFMILRHLDLGEMFQIESVCRIWCYFVKGFVGKKLMIAKTGKLPPRQWFFLDEPCPSRAIMVKNKLDIEPIKSSFIFNLRQLKISDPLCKKYNDEVLFENTQLLNQMVQLEILEISQIHYCGEDPATIKLPNLKHLAISHTYLDLVIDCPKLTSFRTKGRFDQFEKKNQ